MANVLGYMPNLKKLVGLDSSTRAVNVPAVEVHRVETDPDRRARCLKHLLKANHINYSIIRRSDDSERTVSNNMPHALSSAYFLGATVPQLNDTYDQEIKPLGPWHPSPAELDEDWLDVKGDERYARAYVDFFEDKLAIEFAYDWKKVVLHFLFAGQEPLFHGLIGNEGSALIRLAYAFELDSKELGMEGLGQAAVHYSPLHKYMNDPAFTRPSPLAKGTVDELLGHMRNDERFQRMQLSSASFGGLSRDQEELLLEYWNAWDLEDPTVQFEISQKATVTAILTMNRPKQNTFDPGLAQILITSHAVRTLLPFIPSEFHVPLLRQWWLLTVAIVIQRGGLQKSEYGVVIDTAGKDWKYIQHKVVESLLPKDVLGVQVVQAIQETASTWGDNRSQSLAATVTFVDNFKEWSS